MRSELEWREPTACPICGNEDIQKPDHTDPELIGCADCGRLHVEVLAE